MQGDDEVVELRRNTPGEVYLAAMRSNSRSRLWHFANQLLSRERSDQSSGSILAGAH